MVNFDLILHDGDPYFDSTSREDPAHIFERVNRFLHWIWTRPEHTMMVVSHGGFLRAMLYVLLGVQISLDNCEMRQVVLGNNTK